MKKIVVILVGLLFAGIGLFILKHEENLAKRCTEETIGTVIENHEEMTMDDDGTSYKYYPVVSYKVNNRTITQKSNMGSSNIRYNTGESIDILYNPNKVEEFIIKGDKSTNFLAIIFIIVGTITAIAGIIKRPESFV